ncbi:MAG: phosphoribosylaminoimidazolesuccinocarboxamide synthase [Candidatus Caenarcaniphilales bacterium]|nr:phosphoribosylaminoimidazolesuccinocarboxamide synthase [Candidatus Caenarcaniphilales bacterium]
MNVNNLIKKEGKAKVVEIDETRGFCKIEFKDSLTAFNGQEFQELEGKGSINATISSLLFDFLNKQKIKTHFIKQLSTSCVEVEPLKMIPLEVIVRNYAAGSFSKRLSIKEGNPLKSSLVQFHLKDDSLNDPLLTENEIYELGVVSQSSLKKIKNNALLINWLLKGLFEQADICLADIKLEFGFNKSNEIILADELSPDNMRLWDEFVEGQEIKKLDKDRFREGLGSVYESYKKVLEKLTESLANPFQTEKTPVKVNLYITPQEGLLDPTGRTLTSATNQLGFSEVNAVSAGKVLSLELNDLRVNLVEDLCERILVSPASESYEYELIQQEQIEKIQNKT